MRLTGLTSGGSWSNPQYVAEAVDPTGLTFTASYSDGTTASVSPQSLSPSTWGDTVGTQTCTFSYTEDGVTVTCDVDANVQAHYTNPTVIGISYSGTIPNQTAGEYSDFGDATVTFAISDGTSITKLINTAIYDNSSSPEKYWVTESSEDLTADKWTEKNVDYNSTDTLVVNDSQGEDSPWVDLGYDVASPAPSVSVPVHVISQYVPPTPGKTITGISVSGTQTNDNFWYNRFRPYGLEFTITCSDGTTWTAANDDHDGETHDISWSRIKRYDDTRKTGENDCPIICECEADPDSYDSQSSYFWSTGSVTLTITPNPDFIEWPYQVDEISQSATTTLTVTVQNPLLVDGTIPAQTVGQAPDLGTAVIRMSSSRPDTSPSDVTNRCTLTPASWTTAGTDTLVATYTASSGPAGYNTCSVSESVTVQ